MNWFTVGWIVIVVAFLALETWALIRDESGDTASEHVWKVLRKHPLVWFAALALMLWTLAHFFLFGWFDRVYW